MLLKVALVVSSLLLAGCGGADLSAWSSPETPSDQSGVSTPAGPAPSVDAPVDAPPPAWLEAPSGPRWMAFGTFCWDDGCVDMVDPGEMRGVPQVEVLEGSEVTFHLPFDPSEVALSLPAGEAHLSLPAARQVRWTVTGHGYVVLTAWRGDGGDASYVVELVAPTGAAAARPDATGQPT